MTLFEHMRSQNRHEYAFAAAYLYGMLLRARAAPVTHDLILEQRHRLDKEWEPCQKISVVILNDPNWELHK